MFELLRRLFFSANYKPVSRGGIAAKVEDDLVEVALPMEEADTPKAAALVDNKSCGASWQQRDDVSANYHNWLFANDNSDLDASQVEKEILDSLERIVKSNQSGANLVRRMPGLVPQLLQSLRSENFSVGDLSRKISNDVVLVAAILRLANSSYYNPLQPITSIEHSVMVLGQNGLRQLITSVAFKPIIDMNSGDFTKLVAPRIWDQSARCAIANRMLAADEAVDPFEAFLAGLIQNVGLIVSLRIMDQISNGKGPIGSETFCTYLFRHARFLSCSIGKEWKFPDSVITAIEEQGKVFDTAKMSPIGRILSLGDYLSKVKVLVENDRLTEGDPRLLKNLSEKAISCYGELNPLEEYDASIESKNPS
ncbi:MAG TPA: HDOD domain-containing protein [Burkholderiaceae bacterium]|jgi:HD-like signal output (HDOD) protein